MQPPQIKYKEGQRIERANHTGIAYLNSTYKIQCSRTLFPTKLIRLIDGSNSFVTLNRLRQGDVLSNLLFNFTLETEIKKAVVQKNGVLIIARLHIFLGY